MGTANADARWSEAALSAPSFSALHQEYLHERFGRHWQIRRPTISPLRHYPLVTTGLSASATGLPGLCEIA